MMLSRFAKRAGWLGFALFAAKGLVWLALFALGARGVTFL